MGADPPLVYSIKAHVAIATVLNNCRKLRVAYQLALTHGSSDSAIVRRAYPEQIVAELDQPGQQYCSRLLRLHEI